MTSLVGVLGPDAAASAARLERAAGAGARLFQDDRFAVAWRDGDTAASGDGSVVCVACGTVAGVAAAQPLAQSFADGGPAALAHLRGRFSAVVWVPAERRCVLVADHLGTRSVVHHTVGATLRFALDVKDLLPLLDAQPAPDRAAVAQWLAAGVTAATATLYEGVDRVPGGHVLDAADGRRALRRYWAPRYVEPLQVGRVEAEQLLRDEVVAATARAHAGDPGRAVLLSGGLDSASVAAVAGPTRAYSLVFPDDPDVDESELIEHVAASLRIPSTVVAHRTGSLLGAAADYVAAWRLPPVAPTLAVQRPLLETAARDGAGVLLDGQGGDELFGSRVELLADTLRRGRIRAAYELAHRIDGIPERLRVPAARRALLEFGVRAGIPPRVRTLARRLRPRPSSAPWVRGTVHSPSRRRRGPLWWASLADAVTTQRERARAHDHLRHRNTLAGVTGGHPFLQDVDLIELVLRLPPELAFDAHHDRPLLRGAMRGLVPDRILARREKAFFTPLLVQAVADTDAAEVRRLLLAPDAEIRAHVHQDVVRAHLLEAAPAARGGSWAWAIWRLAAAELWLRSEAGRA